MKAIELIQNYNPTDRYTLKYNVIILKRKDKLILMIKMIF